MHCQNTVCQKSNWQNSTCQNSNWQNPICRKCSMPKFQLPKCLTAVSWEYFCTFLQVFGSSLEVKSLMLLKISFSGWMTYQIVNSLAVADFFVSPQKFTIAISDCKFVLNVELLVAVLVLINFNIQQEKKMFLKIKILVFPSMLLGLWYKTIP